MKIIKSLMLIASIFCVCLGYTLPSYSAYKQTGVIIKVVDENKKPIKNADVSVSFEVNKTSGLGMKQIQVKGKSSKDGTYTAHAVASNHEFHLVFLYYLNPDQTNNMEFDPKKICLKS